MAHFVVGVTGGVASGKSAVTALFEHLGVVVADADLAARAVVAPGQPALAEIESLFGSGMILANGMLNRVRMRALVFEDEQARKGLEAITHPRIRELLQRQCLSASSAYVIASIPLLAETGVARAYDWLDRVLVVDAPESVQRQRLTARDGIEVALADRMIHAQVGRARRLALASDVIVNDGALGELEATVQRLHSRFVQAARTSQHGPQRS
jgi:dephospho-CoA kinase